MINTQKLQNEVSYWISLEKEGINLDKNKLFQSWLKEDKQNEIAFKEEKDFLSQINALPKDFLEELKQDVNENRQKINKRKKFLITYGSFLSAACILFVLYFSFAFNSMSFSKEYLSSGKIRQDISLPDNSKISLDANTSVKVEFYEDKREIYLSHGRGFFDVSSNKNRPFIIKTNHVDIKVLGTKFEIINEDKNFEVNVLEGKVRVSNKKDNLIALVQKDQKLILDEYFNLKSLEKTASNNIALWNQGKFYFKQESLKNVIEKFLKYNDLDVQIEDKSITNLPITGNFTSKEFEKFINVLPLIHPVKIQKQNRKIIIKRKI